jgi:hypothetical protein
LATSSHGSADYPAYSSVYKLLGLQIEAEKEPLVKKTFSALSNDYYKKTSCSCENVKMYSGNMAGI